MAHALLLGRARGVWIYAHSGTKTPRKDVIVIKIIIRRGRKGSNLTSTGPVESHGGLVTLAGKD